MTDAQLELARWLAGSDVWRGWCEASPDTPIPSVWDAPGRPRHGKRYLGGATAATWACGQRLGCLPDLASPLLVGPLIEMLREVSDELTLLYEGREVSRWVVFVGEDRFEWTSGRDGVTCAEALCALLREVVE